MPVIGVFVKLWHGKERQYWSFDHSPGSRKLRHIEHWSFEPDLCSRATNDRHGRSTHHSRVDLSKCGQAQASIQARPDYQNPHHINAFQDKTLKETKRSEVLLLKKDLQHNKNVHFLLQQQLELLLQEHPNDLKAEEEEGVKSEQQHTELMDQANHLLQCCNIYTEAGKLKDKVEDLETYTGET